MKRIATIIQRLSLAVATTAFASLIVGQDLSPVSYKQLNWTGPGGCVVDIVHTPCRTIRSHEYSVGWDLGFDGIMSVDTIDAFDKDGSTSSTDSIAKWAFWQLPKTPTKRTIIALGIQNRRIEIDHDRAVFQEYPGWLGSAIWEEDDQQCSHKISNRLSWERLPDSIVAGVAVVGYSATDEWGTHIEMFLAPSLGCQQLRLRRWRQNRFGLRTAYREMVVDSFELGAPSPALFAVPRGFRRMEP